MRIEAGIELSSEAAIAELVRRLEGVPLDGVILNAGILPSMGLEDLDANAIRRQFEVNALAPLLLALAGGQGGAGAVAEQHLLSAAQALHIQLHAVAVHLVC